MLSRYARYEVEVHVESLCWVVVAALSWLGLLLKLLLGNLLLFRSSDDLKRSHPERLLLKQYLLIIFYGLLVQ